MERQTRQRDAIRLALAAAGRPLSPQEILAAARESHATIGLATVYRTIRSMVETGALHEVELPGAASRYELAGKHHHHHFHCRRCDGVFEVEACPRDIGRLLPRGFRLERHEIVLYGLCKRCGARR